MSDAETDPDSESRDLSELSGEELLREYISGMHAVQSGVSMLIHETGSYDAHTPKHLLTGVFSSIVDLDAIGRLLLERDVVTEQWLFNVYKRMSDPDRTDLADYLEPEVMWRGLDPEHLRAAVNYLLVQSRVIVECLLESGVVDEREHMEMLVTAIWDEVDDLEERLEDTLGGGDVTLA